MEKHNLALTLLWTACLNACLLHAKTPQLAPSFTVKVYDFAGVPGGTLAQAKRTAASIFHEAGVQLLWIDCLVSDQKISQLQVCTSIENASTATVKLLPRVMAERSGIPRTKFGAALPHNRVFILFDRIHEITRDTGFSRARVLGHVMAHELGHVLLPGEVHSPHGIMSESLVSRDCERPGIMLLMFTKAQGARMRGFLKNQNASFIENCNCRGFSTDRGEPKRGLTGLPTPSL
jgi:hypothetical protein